MKLNYYPETDSLYIDLSEEPSNPRAAPFNLPVNHPLVPFLDYKEIDVTVSFGAIFSIRSKKNDPVRSKMLYNCS